MISLEQAFIHLAENKIPTNTEFVPLDSCLNRILACDITTDRDYPPFYRAAMDGFAVNSEWYNALEQKRMPNQGLCLAGKEYLKKIDLSKCLKITTGAAVPNGLDAIVRVEDSEADCDMVTFRGIKKIDAWTNISKLGEDILKNRVILSKGTSLNPQNIQALATIGLEQVSVAGLPKIGIITTGDEVRQLGEDLKEYQIRNSNLWSIKSSLANLGYNTNFEAHCIDDQKIISDTIKKALEKCDVLLLCGGVSMGVADYVPKCLTENGIKEIFHKVAIKPGKPLWFGKNEQKAVFGLPGNPLSTFLDLHIFALNYLKQLQGGNPVEFVKAILGNDQKIASIDRFIPFYFENGEAISKTFNGSGDITALTNTNGFLFLDKDVEYKKKDSVKCLIF